MLDLQAETVEPPDELDGRSRASTDDADRRIEPPFARIFLKGFKNGNPNCGHAAGDGDALANHQFENAFRIDVRARKHETRAKHSRGKRNAPCVAVEHRSNGQNADGLAHAQNFDQATTEG